MVVFHGGDELLRCFDLVGDDKGLHGRMAEGRAVKGDLKGARFLAVDVGLGAEIVYVHPFVPIPIGLECCLHAQHLAHDGFTMQQARVGPERTLHHGVNVVQEILRENIVRQWIDRIDQLIEERNRGSGVLRTHGVTSGDVGSIAHSMFCFY